MPFLINGVEPKKIRCAEDAFELNFPNGCVEVKKTTSSPYYYQYTFKSEVNFESPTGHLYAKDVSVVGTATSGLIETIQENNAEYTFLANWDNNIIHLRQKVKITATASDPESKIIGGIDYISSFYTKYTELNIYTHNGVNVWGRPYNLKYNRKTTSPAPLPIIATNRISSPNEHATTGALSENDIIYYGDVLNIQALPTSNSYCVDSFRVGGTYYRSREIVNYTVGGTSDDIYVYAANANYEDPQITCVVETTGIFNNKYTVTITNPNNVDGNVNYYIYGSGEYLLQEDTVDLGAKETLTITGSNTWYKSGMRIEAYFHDNDSYYGTVYDTLNVNNYESSTGETTTTER